MNKIIEEQLKKCSVADLSDYDISTHTYHIHKINNIKLEVNSYYIIRLKDYILDRNASSILSNNWNKGSVPMNKCMKVDVSKIMGKMIYINGIGYDYDSKEDINSVWSGWLPIQDIEILERI